MLQDPNTRAALGVLLEFGASPQVIAEAADRIAAHGQRRARMDHAARFDRERARPIAED